MEVGRDPRDDLDGDLREGGWSEGGDARKRPSYSILEYATKNTHLGLRMDVGTELDLPHASSTERLAQKVVSDLSLRPPRRARGRAVSGRRGSGRRLGS